LNTDGHRRLTGRTRLTIVVSLLLLLAISITLCLQVNGTVARLTAAAQPYRDTPNTNGPIGLVDSGSLHPFNTTMIMGNAVVYSLSMPTGQAGNISIVLAGVLVGGPQQYYLVSERLTLGQTVGGGYTYTLEDTLINLSGTQAELEPGIVSGNGTLEKSIYTYAASGTGYLVFPFKYTPKISVAYRNSAITLSVNATLTVSPRAKILFNSTVDAITIVSRYSHPIFTVGGFNPVGQNLLENVFTSQGPTYIHVVSLDSYLQVFYAQSGKLKPIPEATSVGAYISGGIVGANVYPIYNSTGPLALVSSNLEGFQTLWPLDTSQVLLTLEKPAILSVNSTTVILGRGSYGLPVNKGDQFVTVSLALTPTLAATNQTVTLSAPHIVEVAVDRRGVFNGWNHTSLTGLLRFTLTKTMLVWVSYQPQWLVTVHYEDALNLNLIGDQGIWVNQSATINVRIPHVIYDGRYERYVFTYATLNGTLTNQTTIELTVNGPITFYALYTKQFLVSFIGRYQTVYSKLDIWVNVSTQLNVTLPMYLADGQHARLAFQNYTLANTTYTQRTLSLNVDAPINITLGYTQQYEVNFTGLYSKYYYWLSGWYNQGDRYNLTIPGLLSLNSTVRIIYNQAQIGNTTVTQTHISGAVNSPIMIQLTVTPQYYVSITAPNFSIVGFYNRSTIIEVSAPYYAGGPFKLKVFKEWMGTVNTTSQQLTLSVLRPIHDTAIYRSNYIRLLLIITIITTLIAAVIALRLKPSFKGT
jgi:hypothetical protein